MPEYKGYWIAIVEEAPLRWFSTIERLDRKKMQSPVTGKTFAIWECPDAADSAEAAIEQAKAVIDGCGLNVASDGDKA